MKKEKIRYDKILEAAQQDKKIYEEGIYKDIKNKKKSANFYNINYTYIQEYNSLCRFIERIENEIKKN